MMQVPCYNKDCTTNITETVSKAVLNHVTNNVSWNDKEIKRCYEYFLHMYRNVIDEHVVFTVGTQSNGAEKGTEYRKKYWEHRKRLLNKYLIPQLDTSLLNTTRRRKNYPRRCCKSLATRYQFRTSHLLKTENQVKAHTPEQEPPLTPLTDEVEATLPTTAQALATNVKQCTDIVQSVEDTHQVLEVLGSGVTSSTDLVLFPHKDTTHQPHTDNTEHFVLVKQNKRLASHK